MSNFLRSLAWYAWCAVLFAISGWLVAVTTDVNATRAAKEIIRQLDEREAAKHASPVKVTEGKQ